MTAIMSQSERQEQQEQETNELQEPKVNEKESVKTAKIAKILEQTKQFQEETKQTLKIAPNVPEIVLFPSDWYLDFDSLIDEQISVHHKSSSEAAEYAEKNYKMRNKLETDSTDSTRSYGMTIYKIKQPQSKFPDMVRELRITSSNGIEAINNELARVSQNHDGDILLTILRKQGASKYQTKWEVSGQPAPSSSSSVSAPSNG